MHPTEVPASVVVLALTGLGAAVAAFILTIVAAFAVFVVVPLWVFAAVFLVPVTAGFLAGLALASEDAA